jgi:hypothetical protein
MGAPVPDEDMPTSIVPADDLPSTPTQSAPAPAPEYANPALAAEPDSTDPKTLYRQFKGYDAQSPEELNEFMRNYKEDPHSVADMRKSRTGAYGASMLTGLPRIGLEANTVTPVVSAAAGSLNALPAVVGAFVDPENAAKHLETARERLREGFAAPYKLIDYATAPITTKAGEDLASGVLGLPVAAAKSLQKPLNATIGEAATTSLGEAASDFAQAIPGLGVKGLALKGAGFAARGARAVGEALKPDVIPEGTTYDAAGTARPPPPRGVTPDVGTPVTGTSLRAQPNPIPPPDGTIAAAKAPQPAPAPPATNGAGTMPFGHETNPVSATGPRAGVGGSQGGAVRVMNAPGEESAFEALGRRIPIFASPKNEGPQETPNPAEQSARAQHLADIDKLSSGMLPKVRDSAVSGDYNATGNDWQDAKTGSKTMQSQLASESDALHAATKNVHQGVGALSSDSVDPTTLGNQGEIVRGAIQAIEKHFNGMTDEVYDEARANSGDAPMPQFLKRAQSFLSDKANYMPDGYRASALARLEQLRTSGDAGIVGDGSDAAAPSSIGAAEKFREWLNKNRTLDNMHTTRQLVEHTDTDVAEHGGPGLFEKARAMRTHQSQMLEQPVGIKKLLAPSDSLGINHAIPEHKVMDFISGLDRGQHEHVMNVLRAGAHLSPEIAEHSAAAIREIQAHTISRLHDAATGDGGKWNARGFYNAATQYARNAASTFKDRPDIIKNLQTINNAGNTLHMDKSYPGAVGQGERATGLGRVVETGGKVAGNVVGAVVPHVGHVIGNAIERGVEGAAGKISEASREKAIASRISNNKERGAVGDLSQPPPGPLGAMMGNKQRGALGDLSQRDAVRHTDEGRGVGAVYHAYRTPTGGKLNVTERPGLGVRQAVDAEIPKTDRGQGWGTRMLQRAVDDAHAAGQVFRSDSQVSHGQAGAYKNLASLGYDVKMKPNDNVQGAYHAVGDHVFEVGPKKINVPNSQRGSVRVMNEAPPEESNGSMLNVWLHQGTEGQPGFRKMSKQEAQAAVESTGAKVTKTSILTPKQHGVAEPTAVMSTDRPLSNEEMQSVLAKTRQSAIPQRADNGDESMHVAPGHEQIAKEQGWDSYNPDYFREHNGQTATETMANPKNLHPDTTVREPLRSAYPGIYDDPKEIAGRVKTVPESPHLKEIFGTTREQMHDEVIKRGDVEPKTPMPGMAPKGKGSAAAQQITTPENAARLRDTISAFKDAHPDAYHGMVSWYHMDPMYKSIKSILGGDADRAGDVYHKLNSYTAYASPMSSVGPEIRRGAGAATMAAEGKFNKFAEHGGNPTSKTALKKAPELTTPEMGMEGHAFHGTAHAPAMTRFHDTGEEAQAPKTGAYRRASDAPSRPGSEYQNTVLVGDSHFSRGAGLADVRGAKMYDGSIEGPELKTVHPWYHENVAKPLGVPSTSAQAAQWAALSHETGVETPIGAPKLEIWADQIADAAKKAGVEPKEMWRRIVKRIAANG